MARETFTAYKYSEAQGLRAVTLEKLGDAEILQRRSISFAKNK